MKTIKLNSKVFILLAFMGLVIFAASCSKDNETVPQSDLVADGQISDLKNGQNSGLPSLDPIAVIAQEEGLNELVNAILYVDEELNAGLLELFLNGKDQNTVFAPTDDAFFALYGALGITGITSLPATTVLEVLKYHVTEGRRGANSVVPKNGLRTIKTLQGEKFTVNSDAMITAVGSTAYITDPDIQASNGIIHIIDGVLLYFE
jgi:uncharacterized surface protein with fasciclin (FAS1) repeats